jgi:acyl-CoA thioesterase
MGDFELDTRLEAVEPEAGRFRAHFSRDWEIWGPNGGYVAAIALRAAGCVSRIPRPASFSGHFLRVAAFAPVDVEVVPLRLGRRSESLRVSIAQDGKPVLEALVRTAADGPGLEHVHETSPDVPAPEALPDPASLRPNDGPSYPFWNNTTRSGRSGTASRPAPPSRIPSWTQAGCCCCSTPCRGPRPAGRTRPTPAFRRRTWMSRPGSIRSPPNQTGCWRTT